MDKKQKNSKKYYHEIKQNEIIEWDDRTLSFEELISKLSNIIEYIKLINDQDNNSSIITFRGNTKPEISIEDYYKRLYYYLDCSLSVFITAMGYIDKYILNTNDTINSYTCHRLILISIILAIKYLEDKYYSNNFYAKVGGIDIKELNKLELTMFCNLEYNLDVEYGDYFNKIKDYNLMKL